MDLPALHALRISCSLLLLYLPSHTHNSQTQPQHYHNYNYNLKALLSVAAPGSDGSERGLHQAHVWRASLISRAPAAHFHLDTGGGGGTSAISSASTSSSMLIQDRAWAASLPDICRRATRGLECYLKG